MYSDGKSVGFVFIKPIFSAKLSGYHHPELVIGKNRFTAQTLDKIGVRKMNSKVDEIAYEVDHQIVFTPANVLGPTISKIAINIEKLIHKIIEVK